MVFCKFMIAFYIHPWLKAKDRAGLSFQPSNTHRRRLQASYYSVNQYSLCTRAPLVINLPNCISNETPSWVWPQWRHNKRSNYWITSALPGSSFFSWKLFNLANNLISFNTFTYFSSKYFPSLTCSKGFCNLFISSCGGEKRSVLKIDPCTYGQ